MFLYLRAMIGVIAVLLMIADGPARSQQGRRIALVVGNSAYDVDGPLSLPSSRNNADEVAKALERLNFEVIRKYDLDWADFDSTLSDLQQRSADASVILFYYAGHTMHFANRSYLMPINAKLETQRSIAFQMISLEDDVIGRALGDAARKIVIIDAPPGNPVADRYAQQFDPGQDVRNVRGLAPLPLSEGLLVASANSSNTSTYKRGNNTLYTDTLARVMGRPGVEIRALLDEVAADVRKTTNNKQVPIYSAPSTWDRFYFVPPKPGDEAARERAAKDQAAKEQAAQAAKEQAAREQAAQAAKEQAAREQAAQAAKEQAAREQAAQAAKEQAAREQAAQAAKEQAAREQAAQAAKEQAAREQAAQAAKDQAAREQAAQVAKEQAAREQAAQAAKDQAAREQAAQEQTAREQAAQAAKDQAAKDQAARDQAAQAAKDQAAKDQAAQAAKDQAAKDQVAQATKKAAKERAAQAAKDQAAKEQAARPPAANDLEQKQSNKDKSAGVKEAERKKAEKRQRANEAAAKREAAARSARGDRAGETRRALRDREAQSRKAASRSRPERNASPPAYVSAPSAPPRSVETQGCSGCGF